MKAIVMRRKDGIDLKVAECKSLRDALWIATLFTSLHMFSSCTHWVQEGKKVHYGAGAISQGILNLC